MSENYEDVKVQEADHGSEKIVIEQLDDEINNSIDGIMDKLSLNHSISKIGTRPYLEESGSKVLMFPSHSRYLGTGPQNVSPNKRKVRRHIQKGHQKQPAEADLERVKQDYMTLLQSQSRLSVAAL